MKNIRIAKDRDAQALPDIERSAGQVFREIPELAWIADDEDLTVERHRELIAKGTSWVAVDHEDRPRSHPYHVSKCELERAVL